MLFYASESLIQALELEAELAVVDAHEVEDRGVEVSGFDDVVDEVATLKSLFMGEFRVSEELVGVEFARASQQRPHRDSFCIGGGNKLTDELVLSFTPDLVI